MIEIIIAVTILAMISTGVYFMIISSSQAQKFSLELALAISEARNGVGTMIKEIRETQIANNGAYPIESAGAQEFIFYSDIDKDDSIEKVRYFLDGNIFKKGTIEPRANNTYIQSDEVVSTLSAHVHNAATPIFTYYNGDWPGDQINNPLADPAPPTEVKYINVHLMINVTPQIAPDVFHLESDVAIRNLKENL